MFKVKKKMLALVLGASILALSLGFTGAADAATNTLSVQFKNLKIYFNGQLASLGTQPLIVNGSTYLPVRAISTLFNKTINWDAATQTITIKDGEDAVLTGLRNQILVKDAQILSLQTQLAAAKKTSSSSSSSSGDLDETEEYLNDEYVDDNDLDDITLGGDEDDIVLTVKMDENDVFDDLDSDEVVDLIQDMVDDILDDFEDASITGKIKDGTTTLASFIVDSDGIVYVDGDFTDLEEDLEADYDSLGTIDFASGYFTLDESSGDISFTVKIKYTGDAGNETEWKALVAANDGDIEDYLVNIYSDLEDLFPSADITGEIVDSGASNSEMATIDGNDDSDVTLDPDYD